MSAAIAYGAVIAAGIVGLVWLAGEARRIVQEHKRRGRMRTFTPPTHTTLLNVILREVDVYRSKRALNRGRTP